MEHTNHISPRLSDEQIKDLFITAYEDGSSYWCGQNIPKSLREKYKSEEVQSPAEYVLASICAGETAEFFDQESPSDTWTLTLDDIRKGTEKFALEYTQNHYADTLSGNWDAETADVWFQLCLLGEITFG
jgi:hypothetical protein